MKKNYAELIYVLSSFVALIVFAVSFVIYLLYKSINIYLVGIGLLMLGIGIITKRRLDKRKDEGKVDDEILIFPRK